MKTATHPDSPWPHRLAVLLCCATFPLIWVGGLVTTYDAGMAVYDWPTTYGYNLFLYPWTSWFAAPWDLFIEHGHRLLGALVGLLTIALTIAVWRLDQRRWMRYLAVGAMGLVVVQGLLGGARVEWDQRQLAMVHACVGPAFFALCVALAGCTSAAWRGTGRVTVHPHAQPLRRLALVTCLLAFVQLTLGAQLRHLPVTASPASFRILVWFHLLAAAVLSAHVAWLAKVAVVNCRSVPRVRKPVLLLAALLLLQLALGSGTWLVRYGWPHWLSGLQVAAAHTVQANSLLQGVIVTAHVAVGSLILAVSLLATLRAWRFVGAETSALGSGALLVGIET